jgi:hypothetical protein
MGSVKEMVVATVDVNDMKAGGGQSAQPGDIHNPDAFAI